MRTPYLITVTAGQSTQLKLAQLKLASITIDQIYQLKHESDAFWAVDASNMDEAMTLLRMIRSSQKPAVYLKPVVFLSNSAENPQDNRLSADACCSINLLSTKRVDEFVNQFEPINQWIDSLPDTNSSDTNIAFKLLRFIASRNKAFIPVLSAAEMTGFLYPQLQSFFDRCDIGVLKIIEFLCSQNLLLSQFFKKAHFCCHCECAFLNFEETCPHCSANDLNLDELIHHFKCAYTGELAEFKKGDELVCPKCESTLRHIGVDYDKPSVIYRCNQCAHSFQEPTVISTCYNCGRATEPENQTLRSICSYSVSSIGENAAQHGMESLFSNIMESEIKLISLASFNDYFRIEAARIKRYKKSTSTLALFGFDNLDELYLQLGKRAHNIFVELSLVFKSVLRSSDLITARNESIFIVIMTETDARNAECAIERLKDGIMALFENNLEYKPIISTKIQEITPEADPDKLLEQFL